MTAQPRSERRTGADATADARLAAWTAQVRLADIPEETRAWARLVLLDAIASALTGRRAEERPAVARIADTLGGSGSSTVIGGRPRSLVGATFLNAFQVTGATICDVHRPTLCHVTPEVVPAALAAAASVGASGENLLVAAIVGFETTVRVASSLTDHAFRDRGWHAPGIAGPFGAAAAAGRLLGLDPTTMGHAFGHAGGQAAGTFAALGTSAVKFHQARGAVSGLLAALLAREGLDAASAVLTAPMGGLLRAYAAGGQPDDLDDALGETWRFAELSLRRWPGASSVQALIEASLQAGDELGTDVPDRVRVFLPPRSFVLSGSAGWSDELSALQSARYIAAVVLRDRTCELDQFDAAHRSDPGLSTFARDRVTVIEDGELSAAGARVVVERGDGGPASVGVDVPRGAPERPLGEADVIAKLANACAALGRPERAGAIAAAVFGLEQLAEVDDLLALLADPGSET